MGFNTPATDIMTSLVDLHHDIFFFLILISVFVTWMLFIIIVKFKDSNSKYYAIGDRPLASKVMHDTRLEVI